MRKLLCKGEKWMRLNMLLGTLIGFTIAFFMLSFLRGHVDWSLWIALMIGGAIGHFIMVNSSEHKKER